MQIFRDCVTVFLVTFSIFVLFLTPNINTGDAGEIVTASYFMGIAHPSGYPLYLQIGKFFSFIPFGNVAFRVAIISAFFSSLSLSIYYWIVYSITKDKISALFASLLLFVSFVFFVQSVIAKFYTLNLFIILFAVFIIVYAYYNGYKKYMPCFTFIMGLTLANHHTGVLIAGAIIIFIFIFDRKRLHHKEVFVSLLMFFCGFIINLYVFLRGNSWRFFNVVYVNNLRDFYNLFFRVAYEDNSSLAVVGKAADGLITYWYAFKNFFMLTFANYSIFIFPFFLGGGIYLYKKVRPLFVLMALALFLYGPFLAKLTFANDVITARDYYVAGLQYFVPGIAFYILFVAVGFYSVLHWLKKFNFRTLKILSLVAAVCPLLLLISRYGDSNYRTNFVPYQVIKDVYTTLPVSSIFIGYGDDAIYQSWYLKLIGRYKDDVCQIGAATQKEKSWFYEGCKPQMYGDVYQSVFTKKLSKTIPIMLKNRFYGSDMITDAFAFKEYLFSKVSSLVFLYLPQKYDLEADKIDSFLYQRLIYADSVINPQVCMSHMTDDYLTRDICGKYVIHLSEIARIYADDKYRKTGQKVTVRLVDNLTHKNDLLYTIDVTEKNRHYLALATAIQDYNRWNIFYRYLSLLQKYL
jgi:hypothetical protein